MNADERRALGAFLRTRRARVTPEQAGITNVQRRRTPGLRREEVAQRAGLSVTWYTWIEQGREINISEAVLASVARVLRLTPQEQTYLFTLAGKQPPSPPAALEMTSAALQQLLDHQGHYPAYLMGRFWDILGWNKAAAHLFGDFGALEVAERNMVWYTLVSPAARTLVVDWADRARRLLAEFRADCSAFAADPAFTAFIQRISAASPEFACWWPQHDVFPREGGRRVFHHPLVGRLVLEQTTMRLSNQPGLKLVIHAPLAEADSDARLRHIQKM